MIQDSPTERDHLHLQIYRQIQNLFQMDDLRGVEIIAALNRITQLSELVDAQRFDLPDLSLPRWRLLLHLFLTEQLKSSAGLTPTELSQFQQVSKNTISALLRGLEEQGLIRRELDSDDLRVFRIHLTDAGRQLILDTAPRRIAGLNQMLAVLPDEEVEQLTLLLTKLRHSLEDQFCQLQKDAASR